MLVKPFLIPIYCFPFCMLPKDPSCCCSVAQSCLTVCDPIDHSMPGFLVHHKLPELAQTLVHWVKDAIRPSHPLLPPSPPLLNLSLHQGLFQRLSSLQQAARVLELKTPLLPLYSSTALVTTCLSFFFPDNSKNTPLHIWHNDLLKILAQ